MKLRKKSSGTALIEYVLIACLLTLALVGAYRSVGKGYSGLYNKIDNQL